MLSSVTVEARYDSARRDAANGCRFSTIDPETGSGCEDRVGLVQRLENPARRVDRFIGASATGGCSDDAAARFRASRLHCAAAFEQEGDGRSAGDEAFLRCWR